MRKRLLLILLLMTAAFRAGAGDDSAEGLKRVIIAAGERISSLECDFIQTKESSMLTEKMVSYGRMVFRRPDHIEWRYVEPFKYDFVFDGGKVTSGASSSGERIVREMAKLIISSIEGGYLSDGKMFRTEIKASDDEVEVFLYPENREMKKMWSELVLRYDRKSLEAKCFEMHETSGDKTIITFRNCRYEFSR